MRSFLARKKLLEVRKEFDEVFRELERDSKLVCWKGRGFGLPLITADPLMLADANEETNLSTRQNGDGQKTRKEGFNFDVDVGELLSNAEKNGDNSDTEQCSLASGNLNIGTLCREQGDKESNEDDEVHWPKRPFNSERHGEDLLQNECFLPHDQALQRQENKGERNLLRQKSSEMLRPSDLTAEVTDTDSGNDKYPHKISEFSSSASALSSTLKHMTTDECEMKENAGHDNASGILLPQHMFGKLHLRDQALLSESWMTDRSFGKKLRTVPAFVTAHMFCTSRDTWVFYGCCLLIQGYFCTV